MKELYIIQILGGRYYCPKDDSFYKNIKNVKQFLGKEAARKRIKELAPGHYILITVLVNI